MFETVHESVSVVSVRVGNSINCVQRASRPYFCYFPLALAPEAMVSSPRAGLPESSDLVLSFADLGIAGATYLRLFRRSHLSHLCGGHSDERGLHRADPQRRYSGRLRWVQGQQAFPVSQVLLPRPASCSRVHGRVRGWT